MKIHIKFVFLPALLLLLLLVCASALLQATGNALIGSGMGPMEFARLKVHTIWPQIVLVVSLLVTSLYTSFEKVFKGILITYSAFLLLLAGTYFLLGQPPLPAWPATAFYFVASLFNFALCSLLIWGFINRLTTAVAGVKYYLPLAFVLGLSSLLPMAIWKGKTFPLLITSLGALIFILGALLLFRSVWNNLPKEFKDPKPPKVAPPVRFPYLSSAYLLAGALMAKQLLSYLFKSQIRVAVPSAASYAELMGQYATTVSASLWVISAVWIALGTWLVIKKGWKTTALYGVLSLLAAGVIFAATSASSDSPSWLGQGIYDALLSGTTSALFFPLIQLLYLCLPIKARFTTKIGTEMIALPLFKALPSLTIQGSLVLMGSLSSIAIYLKIAAPILLLMLLVAYSRLTLKFRNKGYFAS